MTDDRSFALLITWTCYGTWLPGDRRGSVSNSLLPEGGYRRKENTPGTPVMPEDVYTQQRARALQKGETTWLSPSTAASTVQALVNAASRRQWRILHAAVMANHVHVVITDCPDDGPGVRRILKGNTQAALNDAMGNNRRWWTAGGSDRYLHGDGAIEAAVRYVAQQAGVLAAIVDMRVSEPEVPPA
jgi:REP element-mobilizing transposase RayT